MFEKLFKKDDYKVNWEYVESIPEFAKLKDCEQNPKWHSEGNVWEHTVKCVNSAYNLLLDPKYESLEPRLAVAAVLFHDIGKITTTEFLKGAWHAYNHEYESEKIARRLLWDEPISIRETICSCARCHMKVLNLATSKRIIDEMIKMSRIPFAHWRYLLFVKECDILGSKPMDEGQTYADREKIRALYQIAKKLGVLDDEFRLTGNARSLVFEPNKSINWGGLRKEKSTVYVFFGLPGAGKNTLAESWKYMDAVTLSRDDIRTELGYCEEGEKVVLSPEKEDEVTKVFNERLISAVKAGKDVILNNLNLKKKYRDAYKSVLNGYDVEWFYVYVEAPRLLENIKRRPTFKAKDIMAMTAVLDWPQPEEYDELIISKQ